MKFKTIKKEYEGRNSPILGKKGATTQTQDIIDAIKELEVGYCFEIPFYNNYSNSKLLQSRFHSIYNQYILDDEQHKDKIFKTRQSDNGIEVYRIK